MYKYVMSIFWVFLPLIITSFLLLLYYVHAFQKKGLTSEQTYRHRKVSCKEDYFKATNILADVSPTELYETITRYSAGLFELKTFGFKKLVIAWIQAMNNCDGASVLAPLLFLKIKEQRLFVADVLDCYFQQLSKPVSIGNVRYILTNLKFYLRVRTLSKKQLCFFVRKLYYWTQQPIPKRSIIKKQVEHMIRKRDFEALEEFLFIPDIADNTDTSVNTDNKKKFIQQTIKFLILGFLVFLASFF